MEVEKSPVVTHVPHHRFPVSHVLLNSPIKLVTKGPEQAVSITFTFYPHGGGHLLLGQLISSSGYPQNRFFSEMVKELEERHLYFLGHRSLLYISTGGLAQFNLPPSEAKNADEL